jgi:exodeoxyribonuclease V
MINDTIHDFLPFTGATTQQTATLNEFALFVAEENTDDFLILSGAAGTGKTSITTALIGFLNQTNQKYQICAPTGRAARILGRKSNAFSSTIHSTIYKTASDIITGTVTFTLRKIKDEEKVKTIFIIDEASMVGTLASNNSNELFQSAEGLLQSLIKYCKLIHPECKIIFLGDRYQLAPIHETHSMALSAKYLTQKFNLKGKEIELTEVMRQKSDSIIMKSAINTRLAIEKQSNATSIKADNYYNNIYDGAKDYVQTYKREGPDYAIAIGCTHRSNQFFNDLVRRSLFGTNAKFMEKGDYLIATSTYERNGIKLYSGDHVTVVNFDVNAIETIAGIQFMPVELKLTNGNKTELITDLMRLDLLNLPSGTNTREMENKLRHDRYTKNPIYRESLNPKDDKYIGALHLTYGHAITCNKAQGGEWQKVLINTCKIPNLNWQYTAITRAQNQLALF